MMLRLLFLLSFLSLVLRTDLVRADLVFISGLRSVGAAVTTDEPGEGSTDMTAGPYAGMPSMPSSVSSSGLGTLTAMADQDSTTPDLMGPSISGMGNVAATATWDGPPGWSVMAVSFFDVLFELDLPGLYTFSASVTWTGSLGLPGGAIVELKDVTDPMSPVTLAGPVMKFVGDQGTDSVGPTLLALSPGVAYELFARADISGGGEDVMGAMATGHWEFSLSAVPEISSFLAMTPLAIIAACCAWRSRQRKRQ